jgi:Na+/melibiose symporter-like transporter
MLPRWSVAPAGTSAERQRNFFNVQLDAIGVGLVMAAVPFLPVFLTRLGASNFEVGLLTALPALGGLVLATPSGRLLQRQRMIVPWLSVSRLLVALCYALTGLVPFVVNGKAAVVVVLFIWAAATIPLSMVNVAFYLVMNAVAGPEGRYDLMSRRWFILGLATALGVAAAGAILDRLGYPLNYQLAFLGLSSGGLIGYYYSTRIVLPSPDPPDYPSRRSLTQELRDHASIIWSERGFISLNLKQFVFLSGTAIATPLFPLYYVRVVNANDTWIGIINTAQVAVISVAYLLWARQRSVHGTHPVLLTTTLAMVLAPVLTALTHDVRLIALIAAVSGFFQAGIDLVFFDELMRSIPEAYAPTFVAFAQSMQYLTLSVGPLIGTSLADRVGIGPALVTSALFRLVGFALFASAGSMKVGPKAPLAA